MEVPNPATFALVSVLAVPWLACEEPDSIGDEPGESTFEYPMDDELRIHHLQVKGTHNSYHVDTHDGSVVDWAYTHAPLATQAACQGVRQFELDVAQEDDGTFAVFHAPVVDEGTTCPTLRDCLGALRGWSDANPAHHPLFVMIEPKDPFDVDTVEVYFEELEAAIEDAWPRDRIVTPAAVKGDHGSVREALETQGWPTLGEGRGKILLWLLEIGDYRDAYTHGGSSLEGRLMFVKSDLDHPFGAILIRDDPVGEAAEIRAGVLDGFLVRTRADGGSEEPAAGDLSRFEAAQESGATFISTDYAVPAAGMDYDITLPGGTPSVCNPVTAPVGCTSEALESPEFMATDGC